ncbi:MAG: cytochrome b/b6 domain-containing protein [Actinomycetota bacterium]|nr:cytochrome b/b6 domain-containing protein [Actinomycetota bacterium]
MSEGLRRYTRRTRWFHAGVYVLTLVTLGTGLWIHFGQEGKASFLAQLLNRPDIVIHEDAGWALFALAVAVLAFGFRGVGTFVLDSLRYRRGDQKWLAQWPRSALTGRFRRHEGHFDPGQRIANLVLAGGLTVLIASGIALIYIHGGSWFVRLAFVHRWAAFLLAPVIAGHIIVASGVLPGYRGVWRSMHWGGRVNPETAQRLWPAWAEQRVTAPDPTDESHRPRTR